MPPHESSAEAAPDEFIFRRVATYQFLLTFVSR